MLFLKKLCSTFILLILINLNLEYTKAQQTQSPIVDVVYLHNGSIIRGQIVELVVNEHVKIETSGGSIFVYQMDEVLKIERETRDDSNLQQNSTDRSTSSRALTDDADYEINSSTGYSDNTFYLGIGLGTSFGGLGPSLIYDQGSTSFNAGVGFTLFDPVIVGYTFGIRFQMLDSMYLNSQFGSVGYYYRRRGGEVTEKGNLIGPSLLLGFDIKLSQSVFLQMALGGAYVINSEKLLWARSQFNQFKPAFDLGFLIRL